MASHLKIVVVTCLLMFILTEEFKPVLAKGGRLKPKVKQLEKSMADLKAKMEEQEAKTKEQEAKMEEQEARMKEQEARTTEQEVKMQEQEVKMQEQEVKIEEREARMKEQEVKIRALEECDGKYKYPAHSTSRILLTLFPLPVFFRSRYRLFVPYIYCELVKLSCVLIEIRKSDWFSH